jgi:hypothetical protein
VNPDICSSLHRQVNISTENQIWCQEVHFPQNFLSEGTLLPRCAEHF